MTITVLFDNTTLNENCQCEWGFACLLEMEKEKLLFDTGLNGDILLWNFKSLEIDSSAIDKVVLSHMHKDHTGGLPAIIKINPDADVYVVHSAEDNPVNRWEIGKSKLHRVIEFTQITKNVFSLGEMTGITNEQSLVIDSQSGIYILTGCAHPGIIYIIKKAKRHFPDKPVKLVMGGFHLLKKDEATIDHTIRQFKELGVQKVGPTHCTGEIVIAKCAKEYGENFIRLGVGFTKTVEVN